MASTDDDTSGLGTGHATNTDEFSEKFQRGEGVIFNPKNSVADFGKFKQGFLSMRLTQKNNFKVCFFNNCIAKNENKTHFEEGTSVSIPLELFRKFIRKG